MELRYIVLTFVMIGMMRCNANPRCQATCFRCFANPKDSLRRMGCLEKCIADGVDQFTCPGTKSFLSKVTKPSSLLEREIEKFFARKSDLFSAEDIEGIAAILTEDSVNIIDHQMPVIGRANRAQKISDLFTANPQIDRQQFDPLVYGEEYGIIWVNGVLMDYDSQHLVLSSLRFMSLLKRIDGKLQEMTIVLFQ
ncbi:uncharacterized protein [Amphiura filiformis]|uniref:uncharacterized protein n=1 Tax=Amphiura filiformis TaxID=82378 RepID=UPI003B20DC79